MDNYLTIIKKCLNKTGTSEDRKLLNQWLSDSEENKLLFKEEVKKWYASKDDLETDTQKAYDSFITRVNQSDVKVVSIKNWKRILPYAAVFAGILMIGYYGLLRDTGYSSNNSVVVNSEKPRQDDKIKIIQDDGTITYMDNTSQSDIVTSNGTILGKMENDRLVVAESIHPETIEYLEISIPKGKIFQLDLSDGTKVWLNAGSTLKFPKQFIASESNRNVYLDGEAFFDVTTNKVQPFMVNTGDVSIEVLGTQFNVSSYPEDITIKTTLVEGSVALKELGSITELATLVPNDQVIYTKQNMKLDQKQVDTKLYTSWMYRKMIIDNESFASVIKRLERTYDIEIISKHEKLNQTRFTGEFDTENVRQILAVFSETVNFKYTINNKQIVIAP